ncbi:hypothetical protein BO94DRAFT_370252 [Aspergillus sclerotioniger CBS 115572]|uniref:Transmembrane protein n=1 Tax=Aspergillus sclerotioniger CBS 115572 TaxID=1450535 RepID=A0A317X3X2_9EURO|nr:hypothetical protein BO94DRAFT_370252 [Aspergillus sclerotioniger CBS 115572]PWY93309.1 hypothetical protein BO94DRAFT_370252 [Aspergillus sclerotioniger CBS 115572]
MVTTRPVARKITAAEVTARTREATLRAAPGVRRQFQLGFTYLTSPTSLSSLCLSTIPLGASFWVSGFCLGGIFFLPRSIHLLLFSILSRLFSFSLLSPLSPLPSLSPSSRINPPTLLWSVQQRSTRRLPGLN